MLGTCLPNAWQSLANQQKLLTSNGQAYAQSDSLLDGVDGVYRACQINRINTTNRINNGLIDLCKLGSRLIQINVD